MLGEEPNRRWRYNDMRERGLDPNPSGGAERGICLEPELLQQLP
jgi:hypothetical protein